MLSEVMRNLLKTFLGGDDMVLPLEFSFKPLREIDILVELLNERENVGFVLAEKLCQLVPARGAARVPVVINQAATGEGFVNLGVEIIPVCANDKREVSTKLPMHLLGEEHHGVAL